MGANVEQDAALFRGGFREPGELRSSFKGNGVMREVALASERRGKRECVVDGTMDRSSGFAERESIAHSLERLFQKMAFGSFANSKRQETADFANDRSFHRGVTRQILPFDENIVARATIP
jgi:hypothetical protein